MQQLPENEQTTNTQLARAVNELMRAIRSVDPTIDQAGAGGASPEAGYNIPGKIAYADGASWNPGSGEGIYFQKQAGGWEVCLKDSEVTVTSTGDKIPRANGLGVLADGWIPSDRMLVYESGYLGAAQTTLTALSLDCVTHGGYFFALELVAVGAAIFRLFFNNDTTYVNYTQRGWYYGVASGNLSLGDCQIRNAGGAGIFTVFGTITHIPSVFEAAMFQVLGNDGYSLNQNIYHHTSPAANITRIDVVSSVSNYIGANSRLRLWRKQ